LGLALDEPNEENQTVTVNDIDLLIAENVLPYTKGSVIDYLNSEKSQGFTISAVSGSC
jgi:Fe-S cluster assembly iron-binding protein IscA